MLVDGRFSAIGWFGETGGDPDQLLKLVFNLSLTYTKPVNGAAVVERWSELETNEIVDGLEGQVHTHEFSNTGLKATLKLAQGGVLTHDSGRIVYRITFDASGNETAFEVVADHGDHPGFYDDLFCSTVVDALDL